MRHTGLVRTTDLDDAALERLSARETAHLVHRGELTARRAAEAALARIAERDRDLNAVTDVFAAEALASADAVDAKPLDQRGPLAGVPVLVKDEFDIAGHVTTLGGFGNSTPAAQDCELVRRVRAADAVILGRTAMPEFGQFPTTESARYGVTHNPWDNTRGPGGSSGGSAASVSARMVPLALGADGGGSLRIPASACGLIGLKPTRGLVSTAPLRQHWFALVALGGLTRTVEDTAALLDVIAGPSATDKWRWPLPDTSFTSQVARRTPAVRVAWTTQAVVPWMRTDREVARATVATAARLADLGHKVTRWTGRLPAPTDAFLPQYYAGMRVEGDLVEHPELLEPRTRQTIALSGWATDRVVEWALRRGEQEADVLDERVFVDHDVLVMPTMPRLTPKAGLLGDISTLRGQARTLPYVANTTLFNVTGHPAMSIPSMLSASGWPIGTQLVARRGEDGLLLAVAAELERQAEWLAPQSPRDGL